MEVRQLLFYFPVYGSADGFFFSKIEKKIYILQTSYFYFVFQRYNTFFFILKQGVQGLQALAFCILTFNDEHTKQT